MKQDWELKKLGEVCTVIAGQSPEGKFYNNKGEGLPFYQGKKEFTEKIIDPPTTWTTYITKEAIKDDILMSVRAPVGPVNFSTQRICIGRGLAAIRSGNQINKDYLFHYLIKHEDEIIGNEGAVFNSINKSQIENIEIPLPSLPEQKHIVSILDKTFAAIDKAKANTEKNLQNVRELFESYLEGVFEKNDESWKSMLLSDLCVPSKVITYGVIKLGEEIEKGVPCLRTSNVRWLNIDLTGIKRILPALSEEYSRTILEGGEVLVNVRGTLGGVAVVPKSMKGWNVSREVAVIPIDSKKANPSFIASFIGSKSVQEWLGGVKKGAAYVGINIEDLRLLPVSLPNLHEQEIVIQKLDDLSKEIKRLEAIYQAKVRDLEEFRKSILDRAFNGELLHIKS